MDEKVKIGFVGCGGHATRSIYPSLKLIDDAELVAICDLREDRLSKNKERFCPKRIYRDVNKMLSEEKLDGVIIIGPPDMHYKIGKLYLEHRLPIFVDKPCAMNSKQAEELAETARKNGVFGCVGYMKRASTSYRMAKEITQKEEFGEITGIEIYFSNGPYPAIWGMDEGPHSFLIGQVIHIFNLVRFFCGEVKEVYANLNKIDDSHFWYGINISFENGIFGIMNLNSVDSSQEKWGIGERVIISGYECRVEIEDMLKVRYFSKSKLLPMDGYYGRTQKIVWEPDWVELHTCTNLGILGYLGEIKNFIMAIQGKEKPLSSLEDGMKDLKIAEAIWESANKKKIVKIT